MSETSAAESVGVTETSAAESVGVTETSMKNTYLVSVSAEMGHRTVLPFPIVLRGSVVRWG